VTRTEERDSAGRGNGAAGRVAGSRSGDVPLALSLARHRNSRDVREVRMRRMNSGAVREGERWT